MKKIVMMFVVLCSACSAKPVSPQASPTKPAEQVQQQQPQFVYYGAGACFDKKKKLLFSSIITSVSKEPCSKDQKGPCYSLAIPKSVDKTKIADCTLTLNQ